MYNIPYVKNEDSLKVELIYLYLYRNNLLLDGRTGKNKGKLILTEIFPSVQKHDI